MLVPFIELAPLAAYGLDVHHLRSCLSVRHRATGDPAAARRDGVPDHGLAFVEATLIAVSAATTVPLVAAELFGVLNHVGPLADVGV